MDVVDGSLTPEEAARKFVENFDPEEGCESMILLAGHPYFIEKPAVSFCSWIKDYEKWRVTWRDFETVKQDRHFEKEVDARIFAAGLLKPPLRVSAYGRGALAELNAFWTSCYERARKRASPQEE